MWKISTGPGPRFCDGVSRRQFLEVGMGLGGLSLAGLMRQQAQAAAPAREKSVIYICLGGGPSQIDTWDLKPEAPRDYRGEFSPIATKVPGIDICELMPKQAQIFDKISLVRGLQSIESDHFLAEVYSGFPRVDKRPAFGSVISRLAGARTMPTYVSLDREAEERFEFENPGYAGAAHRPFRPYAEALADLGLIQEISLDRLNERRKLLASFDNVRRKVDATSDEMAGSDAFRRQALEILSSTKVRDAFDLKKEPAESVARYETKSKYVYNKIPYDWEWKPFLMARRLVEAGVKLVTLRPGSWDHHGGDAQGDIFSGYRTQLPVLDHSIHALITDLHERGLDKDVAVVILGEFGRGPRVNSGGGRDHWPEAGCALFAGGGFKTGQVIGETNRLAERPTSGGIGFQNVVATIYKHLGIDPATTLADFFGRPQFLLDEREPIRQLF